MPSLQLVFDRYESKAKRRQLLPIMNTLLDCPSVQEGEGVYVLAIVLLGVGFFNA